MKYTLAGLLLLLWGLPARGQYIVLPQGTFLDTTSARNPACATARYARYYQVQGKYPRSSDTLRKMARAFLQQQPHAYTGSGYVTFRFVIDCAGHREPRTQVLQTDTAYQRTTFAPALVADLYAFLQTLTDWQVAQAPAPVKYLTYLNFKLQDGQVVAVTP